MEFVNKSSNVFCSGRNDSKIYDRFAWLQVSAYVDFISILQFYTVVNMQK